MAHATATDVVMGMRAFARGLRRRIVVTLAASSTLSKANRQSMNVEGAYRHILTDLIAFVITAIAGAVILVTGFRRADGIASLSRPGRSARA
jgi:hypothetical protein